jgi:predicted AAA+ superfamily ATPase
MNVLPTEILAKILDYLPKDISTLANFGAVCREFYTFSSHDNYWRQCWRRKYHDIEPQQNFKYVLSELHKFKKTNSLIMEGIQVLMVGATGVGKSSISIQQFENIFVEYIDPTLYVVTPN